MILIVLSYKVTFFAERIFPILKSSLDGSTALTAGPLVPPSTKNAMWLSNFNSILHYAFSTNDVMIVAWEQAEGTTAQSSR